MSVGQFRGFPAGKLRATGIPDLFFSELLPVIDDLAELRVTLHVFWLAQQRQRKVKGVSLVELQNDAALLRGLGGREPEAVLRRAIDAAVERGTLLRVRTRNEQGLDEWFFLNTESGRDWVAQALRGEVELGGAPLPADDSPPAEHPNIFTLYEHNIGLLQPLIVEELEEAEKLYPADWVEEAFRIAVENNVRRWRYIRAILERWRTEGKDDERSARHYPEDGRTYLKGKYADHIRH
jgi:DnaD/phage-associated family protein